MSSKGLVAAVLLICAWEFSEAESSCKDRCGMGYYRGYTCQCDFSCLLYGECCKDYEPLCTSKNSCKGRCGETFKRGRLCNCDADCVKYNQCCPDFTDHCNETEEVEGEEPVKPDSCDKNVQRKPTDPTPAPTEEPLGSPSAQSEGNDPDDILIPTVDPSSFQNDDPDSASKQTEADVPDPSPIPEGASGFGSTTSESLLEDFTPEPSLPDLDGFEILPEPPTTAASEDETTVPQTTAASEEETTAPQTTAASNDETPEPPTTAASNDETPEPPTTAASNDETPEPPTTAASNDETPEPPTTAASNDETPEPPTTAASNDETPEPPTTAASNDKTTPGPTTVAAVTVNTDADDSTVAPEPTVSDLESDPPTPEPTAVATDPQTNEPTETTENPTSAPSETPESTESATAAVEDQPELTTVFPTTTTDKETTTMTTIATTASAADTTTAKEPDVTQSLTNAPTSKPAEKPNPEKPFRPALDPNNKPVLNGLDDSTEYPADDSNDMDLCSGRPISGVTTLSNGTVVVFRGNYFWVLDTNRVPGPAQGITQVWGIPSPIDTVFTRCNCAHKTYFFKGPHYWRFENDSLDPGFPKVIETGFDGLRGHVTAALSVPQHNQRRESVYFFKRGGNVQKYSYQSGTNPSCGRKVHYAVYTHRNRVARQASVQVSLLEPTINYRTSWRGFPTTVTAAVSIPNKREPEGYSYYVFSRAKSYKIRIDGDRPVLAAVKPNASHQSNEVFKCPRKPSKSQ